MRARDSLCPPKRKSYDSHWTSTCIHTHTLYGWTSSMFLVLTRELYKQKLAHYTSAQETIYGLSFSCVPKTCYTLLQIQRWVT